MHIIFRITTRLHYLFFSQGIFLIHSPFVFSMMKSVFSRKNRSSQWADIEALRRERMCINESLEMVDYGAKGNEDGSIRYVTTIARLARTVAVSKKQGRIMSNMVHHFQPKTILELGTSLGFGTAYLACRQNEGVTYTIEGSPAIAQQAEKNLQSLGLQNVKQVVGSFDSQLPDLLPTLPSLDFVYIDGNHTYAATLRYFEWCLPYANNNTLFLFDDIHWSPDMARAWETIKAHPAVTVSMDFYRMGCVFLRRESTKEHFVLKTQFRK